MALTGKRKSSQRRVKVSPKVVKATKAGKSTLSKKSTAGRTRRVTTSSSTANADAEDDVEDDADSDGEEEDDDNDDDIDISDYSNDTEANTTAGDGDGDGDGDESTAATPSPRTVPVKSTVKPPINAIDEAGEKRSVRVYCDGIYDMFHFGHARLFEQVKKIQPFGHDVILLVGVCNDELTHKCKGRTVMTDVERYESIRHCRWVDEVIPDAPWILTQRFLDHHSIDYVAHDDAPYGAANTDDVYKFVKDQGKFLPTLRTEGISTSDLVTRIVRNYDMYVLRNLKRGANHRDLNISRFKEKRVLLAESAREATSRLKKAQGKMKAAVEHNLEGVEESLRGFLATFGYKRLQYDHACEMYNGHRFENVTFMRPTTCEDCGALLWGFAKQGWKCGSCNLVYHESCMHNAAPCTK